jgi:phage terminase small subunit
MPRELSLKQRKFAKAYIKNGGNATQAALESYDTTDYFTSAAIGQENLKKPLIKQAIETALIELDLSPKKVLKTFVNIIDKHTDENPNAAVRANENIAQIMNMYPSQKSLTLDDGNIKSLSWQE